MNRIIFALYFLIYFALTVESTIVDSTTTQQWFMKPHKSILFKNESKLKVESTKGQDVVWIKQKNWANLKLSGGKGYETKIVDGGRGVELKNLAIGDKVLANKVDAGAFAQGANHSGTLRSNENKENRTIYLDGSGKSKLEVRQIQGNKSFDVKSSKNNWQLIPNWQNNSYANGFINNDGKPLTYSISQEQSADDATALIDFPNGVKNLFSNKQPQYKCQVRKVGVSDCYDKYGKLFGQVRANGKGEVTVTDRIGVLVASVKLAKDKDGKPIMVLNNGLLMAHFDKQQDFDCPNVPKNSIHIKWLRFSYANQNMSEGGIEFDWPACFEISTDIVLPPGVFVKNLAFKWTVMLLPLGRMTCKDTLSQRCSSDDECLHCNYCDSDLSPKMRIFENSRSSCRDNGGNAFTITARICPPPEANQFAICEEFVKSLGDGYWKKKGDLDVVMEIFNRKSDADFASIWKSLIQRTILIAGYKSDPNILKKFNGTVALLSIPSETEVKEWYKIAKAEKIACHESIVSYTVTGNKIKTDFLLEAVTAGGIFRKNQCKKEN